MDFIDLNINEISEGRKKVRVFCLSNPKENEEYEAIVNNEEFTIVKESTPSMDKMGRMMIVVNWIEPE